MTRATPHILSFADAVLQPFENNPTTAMASQYASAANNPADGWVSTHAMTISEATVQRTAAARRADPTPMIAPVMVCVVDTGTPRPVARNNVAAPALSDRKSTRLNSSHVAL